jgi:regulator of replication initiation timing
MEEIDILKKQIEELKKEVSSLKIKNRDLRNKLDSKNRIVNRMIDDSYNEVHFDDRRD